MRKPLKPKDEIIRDLGSVFRKHGFHGATLSKLTEETGLERASLYHYFPKGKSDMAEAVLMQALKDLDAQVLSTLKAMESPVEQRLNNMLKGLDKFYSSGNDICFITIFSMGDTSQVITAAMKSDLQVWLKLLQNTFKELGFSKTKEMSQETISTIQGSLILSHTLNDPMVFKNCLKQLKTLWERD